MKRQKTAEISAGMKRQKTAETARKRKAASTAPDSSSEATSPSPWQMGERQDRCDSNESMLAAYSFTVPSLPGAAESMPWDIVRFVEFVPGENGRHTLHNGVEGGRPTHENSPVVCVVCRKTLPCSAFEEGRMAIWSKNRDVTSKANSSTVVSPRGAESCRLRTAHGVAGSGPSGDNAEVACVVSHRNSMCCKSCDCCNLNDARCMNASSKVGVADDVLRVLRCPALGP